MGWANNFFLPTLILLTSFVSFQLFKLKYCLFFIYLFTSDFFLEFFRSKYLLNSLIVNFIYSHHLLPSQSPPNLSFSTHLIHSQLVYLCTGTVRERMNHQLWVWLCARRTLQSAYLMLNLPDFAKWDRGWPTYQHVSDFNYLCDFILC